MTESLPPLAPVPPASVRSSIAPKEWEACLDAWLILAELYLSLPTKRFAHACGNDGPLSGFVSSYCRELANIEPTDTAFSGLKAQNLRNACLVFVNRTAAESVADWPIQLDFLSDMCRANLRTHGPLTRVMNTLWKRKQSTIETMLMKRKDDLTNALDSPDPSSAVQDLARLAPILWASADAGTSFMTGSDFLDSLSTAYGRLTDSHQRRAVVSFAHLGLVSLVESEHPKSSVLSDCLYSLKAQADKPRGSASLLADLVTNTPLIVKLRRATSHKASERLGKLLDTLEDYRMPGIARPKKQVWRKSGKGKGKAPEISNEMHMHRMSLVTQVQDLFPDLGSGFILRLLDEYGNDVEQVTANLLDDSLPPSLQSLDRTEQVSAFDFSVQEEVDHLAPPPTPPPPEPFIPDRWNVFDDDELLSADTSRLHIGKRADRTESGQPNKAAILSALATFDADDDERDDTYDVEDVGGTVDTAHPDGEPGQVARVTQEENDMALFTTYKASPELFGRTFDVRRGQARLALKRETGMTDEAIEGWAIMLQRDPRRLRRLEEQFGDRAFNGRQPELASTAYREPHHGAEEEDSEDPRQGSGRGSRGGRGRGRGGHGRGGRGRGGDVAGPSGDPRTAAAQRKKEASKGSHANHNRRDQRAKKMARGGFSG